MSEMEITNKVAQEKDGVEIKVLKHRIGTRVVHGCVAVSFIVCCVTGALLWLGFEIPRHMFALLHALCGIVLVGAPCVFVISKFGRFGRFVDTVTHYDKNDIGWVKAPMGGYLSSKKTFVPAQDKYNTGQKWLAIIMLCSVFILGVTGLLMWGNSGEGIFGLLRWNMSAGMTKVIWLVHAVVALVSGICFLGHFFLAAIFPKSRHELHTMFGNGQTEYGDVKRLNGKWLNTLVIEDERMVPDVDEG